MTIEEAEEKRRRGEAFTVPPALMPDYIRRAYRSHRCLDAFLGVQVEKVRRGEIWLVLPMRADFTNSGGFLYGGILAAMADAISLGLIVSVGKTAVTTTMAMNFVRTHPVEGAIHLHGVIRHNGRRMLTLRGEITGESGALLADMELTMAVMGTLPEVPAKW